MWLLFFFKVTDISRQTCELWSKLIRAMAELESEQASPFNMDVDRVMSKDDAISSIMEYLRSHQELKAIQLLRSFRSYFDKLPA